MAPSVKAFFAISIAAFCSSNFAWNNGQSGNATTNEPEECSSPPYSTHDWIADRALALLPDAEAEWLVPHRAMYLLGTEAPDNRRIPEECGAPHTGYDDRHKGHSVEWIGEKMIKDRAAVRAREEYQKAVAAYEDGNESDAAFYLGAMAHYIGDVSQYGHGTTLETSSQHSKYEGWVSRRTKTFDSEIFSPFIQGGTLTRRKPYTAVKRVSKATVNGRANILDAQSMIDKYPNGDGFVESTGSSLNMVINELADVLHRFHSNEVR